jgi:hypothetical protein
MNLEEIKDKNRNIAILKGIDFNEVGEIVTETTGLIDNLLELNSKYRNNEWFPTIEENEAQLKVFLEEQFYPDKDIQVLKNKARKGLFEIANLKKKLIF